MVDRTNRGSQRGRGGDAAPGERGGPSPRPGGDGPATARWWARLRNPATGLPKLWVEAVMLVSLYYTYTATRGTADSSAAAANDLGWDILHLQERLHIDIELGLNRWLQGVPPLAVICCYYYATLHFIVTPSLLVWMYRRHPGRYRRARWALVFTTLISLCGFFLFPTTPPRLLPGTSYTDTMSHFEAWGWWSGSASAAPDGLEGLANQYAAMPSLHCAWALWCGVLLACFARRPVARVLGCLYPAATVFIVMATSNHYILDAVAGWAVLGVSTLLAFAITSRGRGARAPASRPAAAADLPGTSPAEVAARPDVAAATSMPSDLGGPGGPGG
ncbi:PAP2 superfamily protein [Frankia sp. EI5c]|uniref:phosphatase PAP2 family protein n=1 Tax=Frankia sp. EI5c TaxID=683316 RepID=UPI0007C3CC4A|nr:phosphatase PAP2 family protein [Frankia sp. EI5c]OAA25426.1 PAP2 superfamily protein [Frankia sp. EI5c]